MNKLWSNRYEPFLAKRTFDEMMMIYNPLSTVYPPNPINKNVTFISDTHNNYEFNDYSGDFLIHCGDFTNFGTKDEVVSFLEYFSKLNFKHKIFIAGNHDKFCETSEFTELIKEYKNLTYLCDSLVEIEGLKIFGIPGTIKVSNKFSAFADTQENLYEKYKKIIHHGLDILITHSPPYGYGDSMPKSIPFVTRQNCGDIGLLIDVCDKKPKIHAFGHIHHGYSAISNESTMFINASSCDNNNKIANKPIQLEVADARSP